MIAISRGWKLTYPPYCIQNGHRISICAVQNLNADIISLVISDTLLRSGTLKNNMCIRGSCIHYSAYTQFIHSEEQKINTVFDILVAVMYNTMHAQFTTSTHPPSTLPQQLPDQYTQ
jgi:hypothetical protein